MVPSGVEVGSGQPALPERLPALDGVRGIAILWVAVHNLSVIDGPWFPSLFGRAVETAINSGWMAVTLFFALSGFLISGILLDSRQADDYYRSFYMRRVLRIFPLYYAVLLAAFVLMPLLVPLIGPLPGGVAADVPDQVWLWTYLSNWTEPYGIASNAFPHFWSLAVEEQFYLVWPFLIRHCTARQAFRLCVVVAASALGIRCLMLAAGATPEMVYTFTFSRMDALALGGAAAAALRVPEWRAWCVRRDAKAVLLSAALFVACLLVVRSISRVNPLMQTAGYSLLALSFASLLLGLAGADIAGRSAWWCSPWRIAPLRVLATYSYGMYVFHKILGDALLRPLMRAQEDLLKSLPAHLAYLALATLASLAVAMLSYHLLEKRFLRLKPLFARRGAVTVAST
ncbi:MAG: acyltransferase [Pseudomonadota bacterium]